MCLCSPTKSKVARIPSALKNNGCCHTGSITGSSPSWLQSLGGNISSTWSPVHCGLLHSEQELLHCVCQSEGAYPAEHYFREQRTLLSLSKLCFTDSDLSFVMIVSERGLHSSLFLWSRPVLELELTPDWPGQALTISAISVPPTPTPHHSLLISATQTCCPRIPCPHPVFFFFPEIIFCQGHMHKLTHSELGIPRQIRHPTVPVCHLSAQHIQIL